MCSTRCPCGQGSPGPVAYASGSHPPHLRAGFAWPVAYRLAPAALAGRVRLGPSLTLPARTRRTCGQGSPGPSLTGSHPLPLRAGFALARCLRFSLGSSTSAVAALAIHGRLHAQILLDPRADLARGLSFWRLPLQIGDVLHLAQMLVRVVVTLQAPAHRERLVVPHHLHFIHLPVARYTRHTLVHVNGVIEVRVFRQLVNSLPLHRSASVEARSYGRQ